MSVFDGEIEYKSTVMVDYVKHNKRKNVRRKPTDDSCLIVGLWRDSLKPVVEQRELPDLLCPTRLEHYQKAVDRFAEKHPKLVQKYMRKDIDPTPILHHLQDLKRTEYLVKYCSRDLPFMSINLARRARASQTLRLHDDVRVPLSTQQAAFRIPDKKCYGNRHSARPKYDVTCQNELRRLLRINTGLSSYGISHGLLGQMILDKQPFGPSREEPNFGKWRTPTGYTYWI